LLLAEILRTPGLVHRLSEVLGPANHQNGGQRNGGQHGDSHPPPAQSLRN
jgi:hypothetical protein